jgi:hypothetical protein
MIAPPDIGNYEEIESQAQPVGDVKSVLRSLLEKNSSPNSPEIKKNSPNMTPRRQPNPSPF